MPFYPVKLLLALIYFILLSANKVINESPRKIEKDFYGFITGFKVESSEVKRYGEEEEIVDFRGHIFSETDTKIRIFGYNLKHNSTISFTLKQAERNTDCTEMRSTEIYPIILSENLSITATSVIRLPLRAHSEHEIYFFCLKEHPTNSSKNANGVDLWNNKYAFRHQGTDEWLQIVALERPTKSHILPLWLQVTMVICLLVFSGLFSGLNLGLMALDVTELDILINSGSKSEKKYARTILPLRKKGNFLLCTILLGNVLVNNTLTILLDDLTGSGLVAIVGATAAIVVFGEIIPQAICSRYGLMIGARTIWFTKVFTIITFPLSYPISLILDCILGKEIGYVFNRDRLRELIRVTEDKIDLERDELKIISGALELSKKTIGEIMTRIEDVYMIDESCVLNFETLNQIIKSGYTRIPVYRGNRNNIVALLNVRDLAFVDPDDSTPLKTIISFYKHPLHFFPIDTRLDVILREFKKGLSHLAFVQKSTQINGKYKFNDTKEGGNYDSTKDEHTNILTNHNNHNGSNNHISKNNFSNDKTNPLTLATNCLININSPNNSDKELNKKRLSIDSNTADSANDGRKLGGDNVDDGCGGCVTVGVVTLEDVIEEILQTEIVDEFDIITDNRARSPLVKTTTRDFSLLHITNNNNKHSLLSPQMALATFRFLSTSVSAFHPDIVTENVLQRMLQENIVKTMTLKYTINPYLYEMGTPTDCFIMILEGRVEVEFGKDRVIFEGGPFVYFGVQAILGPPCEKCSSKPMLECILNPNHYYNDYNSEMQCLADYTVKAVTDLKYICVKRAHYLLSVHASIKERRKNLTNSVKNRVETNSCDGDTNSSLSFLAVINASKPTQRLELRGLEVSRKTSFNSKSSAINSSSLKTNINGNNQISKTSPNTNLLGKNEGENKILSNANKATDDNKLENLKKSPKYDKDEFGSLCSLPENNKLIGEPSQNSQAVCNFKKRNSLHSLRGTTTIVNSMLSEKNKTRRFKNPLAHLWQ